MAGGETFIDRVDDAHGAFCAVLRGDGPGRLGQIAYLKLVEVVHSGMFTDANSQQGAFTALSQAARSGALLAIQAGDAPSKEFFVHEEGEVFQIVDSLIEASATA